MVWVIKIRSPEIPFPDCPSLAAERHPGSLAGLRELSPDGTLMCSLGSCLKSQLGMREQDPTHAQHLPFCSLKVLFYPNERPSAIL